MAREFDVNRYWLDHGKTYLREEARYAAYHRLQEAFLLDVLRAARLRPNDILEIGCGFGRITKLLAETYPEARIVALDLSPDQLRNAKRHCEGCAGIVFQEYDVYSGRPLPAGPYDATVAIEVLLHHPPPRVAALIQQLAAVSRYIINIDWSERWVGPTAPHVWVHDYRSLYRDAGLDCMSVPLPRKIDGRQQRLFIAVKRLTAELAAVERHYGAVVDGLRTVQPDERADTVEAEWAERVQRALSAAVALVPTGAAFLLVDEGQTGERRSIDGRVAIPFLERDGQYWGLPADDQAAIRELERLRSAGAGTIVFVPPALHWLESFPVFARHLRGNFRCLLEAEDVAVFDLRARRANGGH